MKLLLKYIKTHKKLTQIPGDLWQQHKLRYLTSLFPVLYPELANTERMLCSRTEKRGTYTRNRMNIHFGWWFMGHGAYFTSDFNNFTKFFGKFYVCSCYIMKWGWLNWLTYRNIRNGKWDVRGNDNNIEWKGKVRLAVCQWRNLTVLITR